MSMKTSLGICIGASTVKAVSIEFSDNSYKIKKQIRRPHECAVKDIVTETLKEFNPAEHDYVCVTGRKFKEIIDLPSVTEPHAVESALHLLYNDENDGNEVVVSLGSENFILYEINKQHAIVGVNTGNKCASGTGEFFLQQIRRMDLTLEKAIEIAKEAEPYEVSGRCSVFCKSDCTHALNKGIPKERVTAGLADMIADKIVELVGPIQTKKIKLIGGVTQNSAVIDRLNTKKENVEIVENADIFEALGAAVYAYREKLEPKADFHIESPASAFTSLPSLKDAEELVTFWEQNTDSAKDGDEVILGLDVGSTTTKALLLRERDDAVLASIYLRTNGNPVGAARNCYKEILDQLGDTKVTVVSLAVTGSGRYIAGLHADTEAIINEIIAHAAGAAHYDKNVDTILEIGGQDAKYTYLVNGVPCDYAMNEACSAGTGSFLEEAAKESLGIDVLDIEKIAVQGEAPPNFNDQCAAFIGSDIRNASHEISRENIVAGLVYSICMNYSNRVKGARKVGDRIFMQGGVCYNKAVPLAMASLLQKPIIVPPDPGLTGAFGVALEAKNRMNLGLLEKKEFDLQLIYERDIEHGKPFICPGTKEHCDRKCLINTVKIEGRKYPFGGVCNKYYNANHHVEIDPLPLNYVQKRQEFVFKDYTPEPVENRPTVGMLRSFLANTLFPFFDTYFKEIGCNLVLSDGIDKRGYERIHSSFCFPAQLSHGMLMNLTQKEPDFYFLPEIREVKVEKSFTERIGFQTTCITLQGEPYYMASAFPDLRPKFLTPVLAWNDGWESMEDELAKIAEKIGISAEVSAAANKKAAAKLNEFFEYRKQIGAEVLKKVEENPDQIAVVLFGRAYNAFAIEANMGIPQKVTSRGIYIIPYDILPFYDEESQENMTWAAGQDILRAARLVEKHPQLFGAFVTNFSCGPDSFIVTYFRNIMKEKPSLTLEIDTHTADAGINTRIEAFLDIVDRYRSMHKAEEIVHHFVPAQVEVQNGVLVYTDSFGNKETVAGSNIKLLIPSMGRTVAKSFAAVFNSIGIRTEVVSQPGETALSLGRANTSCKECLPLTIVVGSLLEYLENRVENHNEKLIYFMPTSHGNCRLGQYYVTIKQLIEKRKLNNIATLAMSSENSYAGMGVMNAVKMMRALFVADCMDDIHNAILAIAEDKEQGMRIYEEELEKITAEIQNGAKNLNRVMKKSAKRFATIKTTVPIGEAKRVFVAGEIYVRRDEYSSREVLEILSKKGIVVLRAPVMEWLNFVDTRVKFQEKRKLPFREQLELSVRRLVVGRYEKEVKRILAKSGLYFFQMDNMFEVLKTAGLFVNRWFHGETVLTIGRFFHEIVHEFHGLISIGPFACLPSRVSEAILNPESRTELNEQIDKLPNKETLKEFSNLPFLAVETDGKPFPQILNARLEAFCLQVERVHEKSMNDLYHKKEA
jgi:predicted CoA-substrate-specific enzyme activase